MRPAAVLCSWLTVLAAAASAPAAAPGPLPPQQVEFFEQKIRPLLSARCYECHSQQKKPKGGLMLDTRAGWEKGGDSGPALVPGKVEESRLIRAVRYQDPDLHMPPKGRLPDREIALLEEWVRRGAPDPRDGSDSSATSAG